MAGVSYKPAPEAKDISLPIIGQYHAHLEGAEIRFLFRSKSKQKGKHVVLGSCRVITGMAAYLATPYGELMKLRLLKGDDYMPQFFVIDLAHDEWSRLTDAQKAALIDHELCHCGVDEDTGAYHLIEHDIEEFGGILDRHGAWKPDLRDFAERASVALQRELPMGGMDEVLTALVALGYPQDKAQDAARRAHDFGGDNAAMIGYALRVLTVNA